MKAIALAALLGCQYQPGSFQHARDSPFPGQHATVGCLDVAVERRTDFDDRAVLGYQFGNRCDDAVEIDLQHATVTARLRDGRTVALAPFDPAGELAPVALSGRRAAGEALAYQFPEAGGVEAICVDVASLVHRGDPQVQCFRAQDVAPDEIAKIVAGGAR